jgi:ATP-dependent Clp protease ATP-binding subunit ClpB
MSNDSTQLDPTLRSAESLEFDHALRSRVVGQEEAVRRVVDGFQLYCAEMRGVGRPVGNGLFLGPTSSGKALIVEVTAPLADWHSDCIRNCGGVLERHRPNC